MTAEPSVGCTISATLFPSPPMPVTAKLSKHFYDVLGEQVAGEMVDLFNQVDASYRTELRESNELHYARFEAKLEQRFAEMRADVNHKINTLDVKIEHVRSDLIKWSFLFWIGNLVSVVAAMKLLR